MELATSYQHTLVDGEVIETAVLTPIGSRSGVFEPEVLRRSLDAIVDAGCVTIDLTRLRWLSAGFLSALIEGMTVLRGRNVAVSVVGMNDRHVRVLAATGLEGIIADRINDCRPQGNPRGDPCLIRSLERQKTESGRRSSSWRERARRHSKGAEPQPLG